MTDEFHILSVWLLLAIYVFACHVLQLVFVISSFESSKSVLNMTTSLIGIL